MRNELERLLWAADVPNPERAELLWGEYRTGGPESHAAFATLLAWYGHALYRRVWGFVRSDAAEDVFQDVLATLHRHRRDPRLVRFTDALPWLRTVADNACRDHLRQAPRRKRREEGRAQPEQNDGDPGERAELRELLAAALGKLSPAHRQAVALVFFEGMDKQAAAAVMGVNRDTLAKRLAEALDRLRVLVPAPAVMVAAGTAGIEGALTAAIPPVSAARLTDLAGRAASKAATAGPAFGKAAAVLLGLSLGGAALAGWAMTRTEEPPPPADQAAAKRPELARLVESVPDRNLRIFHTEIKPRQLAALKELALGDGEVVLRSVEAYDVRLSCTYELRHKTAGLPDWVSAIRMHHNTYHHPDHPRHTSVQFDMFGRGEWKSIDLNRPIILWRNPLTGSEIVLKVRALQEALAASDRLLIDERNAAEFQDFIGRQRRAMTPYLGVWYLFGDPAARYEFRLVEGDWVQFQSGPGSQRVHLREMILDPPGTFHGLPTNPIALGPAKLSPDGHRLAFASQWWSRETVTKPGK